MSDKINLSTFPSSKIPALAMLYLQNQDLKTLTPTELACKYDEVYSEIKSHYDAISREKSKAFYGR